MAHSTRDSVSTGESLLAFFALLTCSSLSDEANKTKPLNIERPQQFQLSLTNLSSTYQMVSGKGSFKDLKFYKECMAHEIFCHPAIWQFSMADISFNITLKR